MSQTQTHIDVCLNLADLETLQTRIAKILPMASVTCANREVTLVVEPAYIAEVLTTLKTDKQLQFTQLVDLCGVDYLGQVPQGGKRFAVVYHLLSHSKNMRIRVKVFVEDSELVPTVTGVYAAAGWYEREAFDMYGIVFNGHPDLRRLLTDYGFIGHPLRKDFPLEGHVEMYYNKAEHRVAYKPVDLPQEIRHFDAESPWKAATGNASLADEDNVFTREEFK